MINIFASLSTMNLFKVSKFDQISKDIGQLIKISENSHYRWNLFKFSFFTTETSFWSSYQELGGTLVFFYEGAQNLQFFLKYNIFPSTVSQPDLFTYCLRNFWMNPFFFKYLNKLPSFPFNVLNHRMANGWRRFSKKVMIRKHM